MGRAPSTLRRRFHPRLARRAHRRCRPRRGHLALLGAALLTAVLAGSAAAEKIRTNSVAVDAYRIYGAQEIHRSLRNATTRSVHYDVSIDRERCWSWNVSGSTLRYFGFSGSRSGCRDLTTFETSGWLAPSTTLLIWKRPITVYTTYLGTRYRVYDDGRREAIASSYATRREDYTRFWDTERSF